MKYLTINGIEAKLPERWQEITWGQYKQFCDVDFDKPEAECALDIMVIMSGIPRDEWRKYKDIETYLSLYSEVSAFLSTDSKTAYSNIISYEGNKYELPVDLMHENIGQYQDCMAFSRSAAEILSNEELTDKEKTKSVNVAYERIFQIFIYPLISGEYEFSKAEKLKVDDLRYADINGWADFFLRKVKRLNSSTEKV